ncbi:protein translocase subunit SecF [Colwellia psychrerythraea]|uniref:Protein-export membrane protein SecF n=1 Tax=Colwellia psychrerythraea TaxID=28229 RepID=A0A099L1Z7_COLPS|nr:protein translocase subunit SecF [Colwellia psychrerythraea]KGJ96886.1 protein-export membrane protein SecF [Colwellia psychrerythraea]
MKNFMFKLIKNLSKIRIASAYVAVVLVLISLLGLFNHGLNLGLDFTGGYLTEFSTEQSISQHKMSELLTSYLPDSFELSSADKGTHWSVQQADNDISLKGKAWLSEFSQQSGLTITPQDSLYIGSQVGEELINQGGLALLTAVIVILLYLSFRFEWRLAAGSVIALFHDVIIVLGLFAWFDISFDLTILASLLAIIGYSLNDSIIVGDKVREIMKRGNEKSIDNIINQAIKSTIARTLITSGTTLATILAIWIFAGESLSGFSIALFSGVLVGTFSSIAISATVPQLLGLTADYYHKKEQEICQLP